jgi:hypothetical protein
MKTLLLLATLLTYACGDRTPDPEGDEYVKCSNFCGEDGVKEFKKSDSGYNCYCYNMGKA